LVRTLKCRVGRHDHGINDRPIFIRLGQPVVVEQIANKISNGFERKFSSGTERRCSWLAVVGEGCSPHIAAANAVLRQIGHVRTCKQVRDCVSDLRRQWIVVPPCAQKMSCTCTFINVFPGPAEKFVPAGGGVPVTFGLMRLPLGLQPNPLKEKPVLSSAITYLRRFAIRMCPSKPIANKPVSAAILCRSEDFPKPCRSPRQTTARCFRPSLRGLALTTS
jgi:hypothetical protein